MSIISAGNISLYQRCCTSFPAAMDSRSISRNSAAAAGGETKRTVDMSDLSDIEMENRIASAAERKFYYLEAIREDSDDCSDLRDNFSITVDPRLHSNASEIECCESVGVFCCSSGYTDNQPQPARAKTKEVNIAKFESFSKDSRDTEVTTSSPPSSPVPSRHNFDHQFFELAPFIFQ
eukprot:Gregarina_sp_Poly_1__10143@NODE_693_length_6728_cov_41_128809_g523_i0_p4_GENE_NODE_693_length_6728_cov_41_128809_g523_i0NODE_693_length_6728_cov_41_128809_g523_i0_p4_ORF_typecomplete_len178_score29_91_NODE_693_length_6728_cov_41_128809_g523_i023722905